MSVFNDRRTYVKIGDLVSEKAATAKRIGTVVTVYDGGGETRIVVQFNDGSEAVFFASEVVAERI